MKTELRMKLLLLGAALSTVPALVTLAEIAVRIFATRIDPLTVFVSSPQLRSDTQGETTRGMFEFDPLLCWRLKPNLRDVWWDYTPVWTNGRHLRMDHEVGPKSGLRIITLGDSVTFGYRVPVAPHRDRPHEFDPGEKPYPRLLEEMLRERQSPRGVEVLPLACPGYTSGQGLAWMRRDIADLQPDIVIACFGWNDVRTAGLPDRVTMPASRTQAAARRLIGSSQLLLHLAASAAKRQAVPLSQAQPEPRSSAEEYAGHFIELSRVASQHGAWFGILLPVYRDPNLPGADDGQPGDAADPAEGGRMTRYRDHLRDIATRERIPVLEIPELEERAWPGNRNLFGERIHPNAAGHRLIAERLAGFLAPVIGGKR
jgi:lysophospholipase L1-like esterase